MIWVQRWRRASSDRILFVEACRLSSLNSHFLFSSTKEISPDVQKKSPSSHIILESAPSFTRRVRTANCTSAKKRVRKFSRVLSKFWISERCFDISLKNNITVYFEVDILLWRFPTELDQFWNINFFHLKNNKESYSYAYTCALRLNHNGPLNRC